MFFRCTNCQTIHEPPLPPAISSNLTHCPSCGSTVTMVAHDTERPGPPDDAPVHELEAELEPGTAGEFCRECAAPVWRNEGGVLPIHHADGCSRGERQVVE